MSVEFALLMFPALLVLIFMGFPVAFSLMGIALVFGVMRFGDSAIGLFVAKVDDVASNYVLGAVPLFIFMGVMLMGGWIFGGVSMCSNKSLKSDLKVTNTRVENCKQELVFAENLTGDSADYKFEQLASRVLGSLILGEALSEDDSLRAEVKKKSKVIYI